MSPPSHSRQFLSHLVHVGVRATLGALAIWFLILVPLPLITPELFLPLRLPLAIFILLAYLGKLLYDTCFFERYH